MAAALLYRCCPTSWRSRIATATRSAAILVFLATDLVWRIAQFALGRPSRLPVSPALVFRWRTKGFPAGLVSRIFEARGVGLGIIMNLGCCRIEQKAVANTPKLKRKRSEFDKELWTSSLVYLTIRDRLTLMESKCCLGTASPWPCQRTTRPIPCVRTYAEILDDIVDDVISPTTTAGTIRRLLRRDWAIHTLEHEFNRATAAIRRPATQLR